MATPAMPGPGAADRAAEKEPVSAAAPPTPPPLSMAEKKTRLRHFDPSAGFPKGASRGKRSRPF